MIDKSLMINFQNMDLSTLFANHTDNIVFQAIAGSHAYGLTHEQSDEDIRGIFIIPASAYLATIEPVKMLSDEKNNNQYYSLRRVMELIAQSNPNMIELIFTPSDCIQKKAPVIDSLLAIRDSFVSKALCDGFIGFAQTQLKKARGQNKWINKPQGISPALKEDFTWIVLHKDNQSARFPSRPISLGKSGIDLTQCHVSSLEHCPYVYRLYQIGKQAKGVFRNETLVCESISEKQEKENFIGLMIYNKAGFETAVRDYQNYWQWRNNRNEQRWRLQEDKIIDYDPKNMMHMFRLLLSGENILQKGVPLVRVDDRNRTYLKDVLAGKYSFDEIVNVANEKMDSLTQLKALSSLRDQPDITLINQLLYTITQEWEKSHV